jgi:hypothetical protein
LSSSSADAIAWAEQLPAGKDRERAAEVVSQSLLRNSPEKAAVWAVQVTDENRRQQLISAVAGYWAQSNKTAAEQWLIQLGLSDEQRQKMLKPTSRDDYLDYMYFDE